MGIFSCFRAGDNATLAKLKEHVQPPDSRDVQDTPIQPESIAPKISATPPALAAPAVPLAPAAPPAPASPPAPTSPRETASPPAPASPHAPASPPTPTSPHAPASPPTTTSPRAPTSPNVPAAPTPPAPIHSARNKEIQESLQLHGSGRERFADGDVSDKDVPVVRGIDQSAGGAMPVSRGMNQSAGGAEPPAASTQVFASVPDRMAAILSALLPYTEENMEVPVQQYLNTINSKHTAGLLEAMNENPEAGPVFGAAYRLHKAAVNAVTNGENAFMLAALGQDVVRAMDLAGRRSALREIALERVLEKLRDGCELVGVYGKDGWLLHMACNDHIKPDFDNAHNAIVDAVEAAGLEVPGKPAPLARGVYLDVNRNLRRCLKRMGGGSVAQGLKSAKNKQSLDDALELASQLGVSAEAVARELALLPADVPLDAFYTRMVARQEQGQGRQLAVEHCKTIFNMYDKDQVGYLDRNSLRAVLADLGALDGLRPAEMEAAVGRAFSLADRDSNGRITAEEFARYYETLTCSNARKHLRLTLGPAAEVELKQFFDDFCSFGTRQVVDEMDNVHFAKFCKDCNLLGRDLTVTDIDLAFARAKPKGCRKLSFEGFLTALAECAERKGVNLETLVRSVLACQGPVARATKAENVRLHDDRSTYTGVYAKGGPKVSDTAHDLATLLDRSFDSNKKAPRALLRQSGHLFDSKPQSPVLQPGQGGGVNLSLNLVASGSASATPTPSHSAKRRSTVGGAGSGTPSGKLQDMWLMWANFGTGNNSNNSSYNSNLSTPPVHTHSPASLYHLPPPAPRPEMGVAQFIKLVRETGLLDKHFTAVQAELIFVRAKPKDSAKLNFEAFERAMRLIAEAKGVNLEDVERSVVKSRGPMLTARQH